MELEYIARDGKRFNDPLLCQDYERSLGPAFGTVARAKIDIKGMGEQRFINGLLKVYHINKCHFYGFTTHCIDKHLENYVNPENLEENKRYLSQTFADVLAALNKFDDEDLCEYEFIYSDNRQFNDFACCRTSNNQLWDILMKDEQKLKRKNRDGE